MAIQACIRERPQLSSRAIAAVASCEAGSPIAGLAVSKLVLPIGGEPIGPKTKSFTATLAIKPAAPR